MPRYQPNLTDRGGDGDLRSIAEQRAAIGLATPDALDRRAIWSEVRVPSAGLVDGYYPHRIAERIHNAPARAICVSGGVRFGKSLGLAMEGVVWTPYSDLIWLAGNSYDLCRQEFEYMAEALTSLGWTNEDLISMPRVKYQPCAMETEWGCRIETRTLHDVNTFVARAPDFIGVCEPGQAPAETLAKSRERLSTRRGRLWLAGTFEDVTSSWYEDVWRRWARWPNAESGKSISLPTWLNTYTFPGGKLDPEIVAIRTSYESLNEFLLRVAGVPVTAQALVIGDYWEPRRNLDADLRFMPTSRESAMLLPVELAIDPGFSGGSHYVVEAIQVINGVPYVVDELAVQSLVHEEVIQLCRQRPWWPNVTGGVIDPYAGGSHIYGAVSPKDVWWTQARVNLRLAPRWPVDDSITRLCHDLRDPVTSRANLFVSGNCSRLVWEMSHWRRIRTKEGYGKPSDKNCDAVKALSYWLADRYNRLQGVGFDTPIVRPYTWN